MKKLFYLEFGSEHLFLCMHEIKTKSMLFCSVLMHVNDGLNCMGCKQTRILYCSQLARKMLQFQLFYTRTVILFLNCVEVNKICSLDNCWVIWWPVYCCRNTGFVPLSDFVCEFSLRLCNLTIFLSQKGVLLIHRV